MGPFLLRQDKSKLHSMLAMPKLHSLLIATLFHPFVLQVLEQNAVLTCSPEQQSSVSLPALGAGENHCQTVFIASEQGLASHTQLLMF